MWVSGENVLRKYRIVCYVVSWVTLCLFDNLVRCRTLSDFCSFLTGCWLRADTKGHTSTYHHLLSEQAGFALCQKGYYPTELFANTRNAINHGYHEACLPSGHINTRYCHRETSKQTQLVTISNMQVLSAFMLFVPLIHALDCFVY